MLGTSDLTSRSTLNPAQTAASRRARSNVRDPAEHLGEHRRTRGHDAELGKNLAAGRCPQGRLRGAVRPRLGHAGDRLYGIPLGGRASRHAGAGRFPHHRERRRHPDGGDGRGGRGRARDRDPRRIRRAAGTLAGRRHRGAEGGRARRPRAWLRSQSARLGGAARRDRGEELSRRGRHQGPRALLRLPGRGRRRREDLHGARRLLRRCRHRDHLASRRDEPRRRRAEPRGRAHRLHVPRPRLACRRLAASRPQRARRGRADECRRQLHARAHAVGRAHPLRGARCRRRRAERRAGLRKSALLDPRARRAGHECAGRAGAQRSPTAPR